MHRIQYQRLPFGPRRENDSHRSSLTSERRIRKAKTGAYLKAFGSRPESKRSDVRRAA